jgi:hypothetical protein
MTFTERTSYLEDDPFFFFFFEMDQIVLGNLPNYKRNAKNFTSDLIVLGDLPND